MKSANVSRVQSRMFVRSQVRLQLKMSETKENDAPATRVAIAVSSEVAMHPPTSTRDILIWAPNGPRPTKAAASTRRGRERKLKQGRTVGGQPTRGLHISKTDRTDSLHYGPAGGGVQFERAGFDA